MNLNDKRSIEATAEESIAKMRAARLATNEVSAALTRDSATNELQPLLDRVVATHNAALTSARDLASKLTAASVKSILDSTQFASTTVAAAKAAADQLKATPGSPQANTTRDEDDEAVTHLTDLKAAFQNSPEATLQHPQIYPRQPLRFDWPA
jgi:hypothetical protein